MFCCKLWCDPQAVFVYCLLYSVFAHRRSGQKPVPLVVPLLRPADEKVPCPGKGEQHQPDDPSGELPKHRLGERGEVWGGGRVSERAGWTCWTGSKAERAASLLRAATNSVPAASLSASTCCRGHVC